MNFTFWVEGTIHGIWRHTVYGGTVNGGNTVGGFYLMSYTFKIILDCSSINIHSLSTNWGLYAVISFTKWRKCALAGDFGPTINKRACHGSRWVVGGLFLMVSCLNNS